jgi:hypothetical protein
MFKSYLSVILNPYSNFPSRIAFAFFIASKASLFDSILCFFLSYDFAVPVAISKS